MGKKFDSVFVDIVNRCNAKCPYCLTGKQNRAGENGGKNLVPMSVEEFRAMMDHLIEHEIIVPHAWVGLYNWYEPMLNPHLADFLNVARERGLQIGLSTNASVLPDLNGLQNCDHLSEVIYSMCGFSQRSYDKIHGFNFETVKQNIEQSYRFFREHNFTGSAYIHYHVYQFNIGEVYEAKKFADAIQLPIKFTYAYFNNDEFRDYLDGTMTAERLTEVSKDLFFHYLDDLFEHIDYYEEQFEEGNSLTISENGNLIRDRNVNDDDAVCSIFSLKNAEEVHQSLESSYKPDEIDRKIAVWGRTFNMTINHLFGFGCEVPDTIQPL